MRRGGPAGRVRGHRMTGGTPKEVHWTAEQQKRPQRTYRGRKRRETARARPRCFRPQNVVFVNPPKDSPEELRNSTTLIPILDFTGTYGNLRELT